MRNFISSFFSSRYDSMTSTTTTEAFLEGEEEEEAVEPEGWIGVDLDGTLAEYRGWKGPKHIGKPIASMMARVKDWQGKGYTVKILTARASVPEFIPPIAKWLAKHGLEGMEITNSKDMDMIELWDDRCVQVIFNTGMPVRSHSFMAQPRVPVLEETPEPTEKLVTPVPFPESASA